MPVRFRCAYCNQLMAIARRKAGKVVRCPKCAGEIIVPTPDADATPSEEHPTEPDATSSAIRTFEDGAFDQAFAASTPATPSKPAAVPTLPVPTGLSEPGGLVLSLPLLVLVALVVLVLLLVAFLAGMAVGRGEREARRPVEAVGARPSMPLIL